VSRAPRNNSAQFRLRSLFVFGVLGLAAAGLAASAVRRQVVERDFLVNQGERRAVREVTIEAHRGAILDRNGRPLAISTPLESVYAVPRELATAPDRWPDLAKQLKRNRRELERRVSSSQDREFMWLARHLSPTEAAAVQKMNVPGVYLRSEYRRFYPEGEVLGHVLGFTNQDDAGLEALELVFDSWLAGEDGKKRVIKDNNGRRVDDVENIRTVRPGRDLVLALDTRIQHLAYRELKRAIEDNRAVGGSVVVIDVRTGEVLAMANQPAFNPNDRDQRAKAITNGWVRNRAVTDMLEPGSSIKPFVVAAALESGRFNGNSVIDTGSGFYEVNGVVVQDERPLGKLPMAGVLAKSSNVGMAKIVRELEPQQMWNVLTRFGFGRVTASQFPGESAGSLPNYSNWRWVTMSSLSRGYNMEVTPLQLAQAYATLGAMGVARPVSLLRVDEAPPAQRVLEERHARTMVSLLESVVKEGSGSRAAVPGYRVAGKTGTARKVKKGERGYYDDRYTAVFGGVAPASNPRFAAVVVIDDPRGQRYYGGEVAAPVFSAVVGGALRLMGVAPDAELEGAADPLTGVVPMVAR
jgi:cell division protein FtsI (penicillin-binding protein 3)